MGHPLAENSGLGVRAAQPALELLPSELGTFQSV